MWRNLKWIFFFNDTATTEIYTLSPTRRSSDLEREGGREGGRRELICLFLIEEETVWFSEGSVSSSLFIHRSHSRFFFWQGHCILEWRHTHTHTQTHSNTCKHTHTHPHRHVLSFKHRHKHTPHGSDNVWETEITRRLVSLVEERERETRKEKEMSLTSPSLSPSLSLSLSVCVWVCVCVYSFNVIHLADAFIQSNTCVWVCVFVYERICESVLGCVRLWEGVCVRESVCEWVCLTSQGWWSPTYKYWTV